ncbi:TolB family protein [Fictibacillus sp. BK138]|uniref:TolB family protein n=1 Tax=Fictibacillus sp. BK138 TaxID=2512121 RepID=UPI00102A10A3|nr:PD40 domain-containing protein [Fictibacillus sp. BK138]RZT15531.1 WD40 repeat protein [Fictibacillus sp. BK138]
MKLRRIIIISTVAVISIIIIVFILLFTVGLPSSLLYYPEKGIYGQVSTSPDDSKIIYSYFVDGQSDLYEADYDGGDAHKITSTKKTNEINPVFSSDGKKILYLKSSYDSTLKQSLWIKSLDKNSNKQLTSNDELVTEAIFSPEGHKIYFLKAKEFIAETPAEEKVSRKLDLYETDLEGSKQRKLTSFDADIMSDLSIDSSGKNIAFLLAIFTEREDFREQVKKIKGTNEGIDLVLFSTETRSFKALNPYKHDPVFPVISPDGKKFVYVSEAKIKKDPSTSYFELYRMNSETLEDQRITNIESNIKEPFFTKKGDILFLYDRNYPEGQEQLFLGKIDRHGNFNKVPLNH